MPTVTFTKSTSGTVTNEVYLLETAAGTVVPLVFRNNAASANVASGERFLGFEFAGSGGASVTIIMTAGGIPQRRTVRIPPKRRSVKTFRILVVP